MIDTTLICETCQEEKPISSFYGTQKRSDTGEFYTFHRTKCRSCISKRQKERLSERFDEEELRKQRAKERLKSRCKKHYNTTTENVIALLEQQNGKCAICARSIDFLCPDPKTVACIDHNHTTGKVRGILCRGCNVGIGYLQESLANLANSIAYLQKHQP